VCSLQEFSSIHWKVQKRSQFFVQRQGHSEHLLILPIRAGRLTDWRAGWSAKKHQGCSAAGTD
jgi:hypothetical protein